MARKPISVKLSEPVEFAGKKYETLVVREPKVKGLRSIRMTETDTQIDFQAQVAAIACDVDEGVIDELSATDWRKLLRAVEKITPLEPEASDQDNGATP